MSAYTTKRVSHIPASSIPALVREASLDLTYRCNNACRHCWLSLPADVKQREEELTFDETRTIVDEGLALGFGHWSLSGGEPML